MHRRAIENASATPKMSRDPCTPCRLRWPKSARSSVPCRSRSGPAPSAPRALEPRPRTRCRAPTDLAPAAPPCLAWVAPAGGVMVWRVALGSAARAAGPPTPASAGADARVWGPKGGEWVWRKGRADELFLPRQQSVRGKGRRTGECDPDAFATVCSGRATACLPRCHTPPKPGAPWRGRGTRKSSVNRRSIRNWSTKVTPRVTFAG